MEKISIPEENSLNSFEGVTESVTAEDTPFLKEVQLLQERFEHFTEGFEQDVQIRFESYYPNFISFLSGEVDLLMVNNLPDDAKVLARARAKLAIDQVMIGLELFSDGVYSLAKLDPEGLICHTLYNAFQSYSVAGIEDGIHNRLQSMRKQVQQYDNPSKSYDLLVKFLEDTKNDLVMQIDATSELSNLIGRLR